MRYVRIAGATFLVLLLVLLPIAAVLAYMNVKYGVDDAYAQWGAVDMTIDYMEQHDGKWPPNWNALRPYFDAGGSRVGGWSFEKYQGRVAIDFSANADDLRRQSLESESVNFDVIHAKWTFGCHMGDGPNSDLYHYFRRSAGIFESPEPADGWQSPEQKKLADEWYQRGFHVQFDDGGNLVSAWTHLSGPRSANNSDLQLFRNHSELKSLNLVGADDVNDAGLAIVKSLPNLEALDLSGEKITDASLDQLTGHPRLSELDIFGTSITDTGFQRLRELPSLKSIRYDDRRISAKVVQQLKAALPNLQIQEVGVLNAPAE